MAGNLIHYQRNLPHRLPPGETLFITFRLAGSLPQAVLDQLRTDFETAEAEAEDDERYARQRRYFGRFEQHLDGAASGPTWLRQPAVAQLVRQGLHFYDDRRYNLLCYCIMANRVHLVAALPEGAPPLAQTLQALKGYTANQANKLLGRSGQF